jgi:hypothetical protein
VTLPIVGGAPAEPGVYDDAAAVVYGWGVACTGVLIAPDVVLTAGHCGQGVESVVLGTTDYTDGGETIAVSRVVRHDAYASTVDLAVLVLATPASVAPRPLVTTDAVEDGAPVVIAGYGATNSGGTEYGTALMAASTAIVDADCSDGNGCWLAMPRGTELVAGGGGIDTCSGDSGGPLYLLTDGGPKLLGITARATADAEQPCGNGGIYVRVDTATPWLEATTGDDLDGDGVVAAVVENAPPTGRAHPMTVIAGEGGTTQIIAEDADGDQLAFAILDDPLGSAFVSDSGLVAYHAPTTPGSDDFVVVITDDGDPPASTEVLIAVDVVAGERKRGCSTDSGAGSSGLALALAALAVRRRTPGARIAAFVAAFAALAGCTVPGDSAVEELPAWTVHDLWDGVAWDGAVVSLPGLVVTSPLTADGTALFVADAGGGPRSGLRVDVELAPGDVPAVGTTVDLTGRVRLDGPPELAWDDPDGLVVAVGTAGDPAVTALDGDDLDGALVSVAVAVTSVADPLGHADADPVLLAAAFGVSPPPTGATGTVTGIAWDGRLSARFPADLAVAGGDDTPVAVDLADVATLPERAFVTFEATFVSPWTADGRYAVVQDADGHGLWLDAEGFGGGWPGDPGLTAQISGEVRSDGEGLRLRTWLAPVAVGRGAVVEAPIADGALTTGIFQVNAPVDDVGDRPTAERVYLGDRFGADVAGYSGAVKVTGPVRVMPDGTTRLFPLVDGG